MQSFNPFVSSLLCKVSRLIEVIFVIRVLFAFDEFTCFQNILSFGSLVSYIPLRMEYWRVNDQVPISGVLSEKLDRPYFLARVRHSLYRFSLFDTEDHADI